MQGEAAASEGVGGCASGAAPDTTHSTRHDAASTTADAALVHNTTTMDSAANATAASSTTTAAPPLMLERGVCPVKAAYRCAAPPRVSLDGEGRTRGMNRGVERARSDAVTGTQRPTLEGEANVLDSATLCRVKAVVRAKDARGKQGGNIQDDGVPASTEVATQHTPHTAHATHATVDAGATATAAAVVTCPAVARDDSEHDGACHVTAVSTTAASCGVKRTRATLTATAPATAAVVARSGCSGGDACDGDVRVADIDDGSDNARERFARQRERARGLLAGKLILAPLTTVGNLPFRRICKEHGADVTMSEMALVPNLLRMQRSEWALLRRHRCEDVFGIQVAVGRPHEAALFARALEASGFDYDFVDLNCGCPVDAMVRRGYGCGLAERKGRLRAVVQQLAMQQRQPVTVKCRIGADELQPSLHASLHEYATWGAAAVTVHGRSRRQRYTREANWHYVQRCAQCTTLPVVGNGDVLGYEDVVQHRRDHTDVCAYMIGRGALIKPWIFDEIKSGQVKDIHSSERLAMLQTFCSYGLAHWGADTRGVMTTRRYLCEWLSFLHRYVPAGLLERLPQRINERPPHYSGRNDLETLFASDSVADWVRITELLLGPAEPGFRFTPKHKSNSYITDNAASEESDMHVCEG